MGRGGKAIIWESEAKNDPGGVGAGMDAGTPLTYPEKSIRDKLGRWGSPELAGVKISISNLY
jgi:hypothetical protein